MNVQGLTQKDIDDILKDDPKVGDLVTYEDMANPRKTFRVVAEGINSTALATGADYQLEDIESGEITYSDLRQNGWTFVRPLTDAMAICNGCDSEPMTAGNPAGYGERCLALSAL